MRRLPHLANYIMELVALSHICSFLQSDFPLAENQSSGERCRGEMKSSPRGKSQFPP